MTLDEVLAWLFPAGHEVLIDRGVLTGQGAMSQGKVVRMIGVTERTAVGIDEAVRLSGKVLEIIKEGGQAPILVLIDSDSQRMSMRDELLGLNEFLAHLAKCLMMAEALGHRTVGLLYGHSAAGALIVTALATGTLVALPGAEPAVMDLPSMSRVTKLPIEMLETKAKSTVVFAPGLDNLTQTGAVATVPDPNETAAMEVEAALFNPGKPADSRDWLGKERRGRPKAADIAQRVYGLVRAAG